MVVALAPFGLGLAFFVFVISRFDLRQLAVGRGDHWITGGALAISTLAAAWITTGAKALATLGSGGGMLEGLAVGLWVLTMLWLPVLLLAEALHSRPRYDVRRWSTVFPVGMYAACSFAVGRASHTSAVTSLARVWVSVALAGVRGDDPALRPGRAWRAQHGTAGHRGGLAPRRPSPL